ncbi:hypothetical protein ACRAKI_02600 [Saccharothrix isguenensis]
MDRSGVTAVAGLGVGLLIAVVVLVVGAKPAHDGSELPGPVLLAAMRSVSSLMGGLVATGRVCRR